MSFAKEPQDVHGECRREIEELLDECTTLAGKLAERDARLKTIQALYDATPRFRMATKAIARSDDLETTLAERDAEIAKLTQSDARWRELAEALESVQHAEHTPGVGGIHYLKDRVTAARKAIADAETEEESPNE